MSGHHSPESRPLLSVGEKDGSVETSHVVELREVSLSFGEKRVLDAISLAVDPQERLVIIGQSGMGKTTILRLVLGVIQPTQWLGFIQRTGHLVSHAGRSAADSDANWDGLSGRGASQFSHRV